MFWSKSQNFRLRRWENCLRNACFGSLFCKIFAPTARFLPLKVSVNLYSAPQAKILGFSVLYKGKSYSFIHIKHPYRAPQADFFGFSVLYKGKSYSFVQGKHPYRAPQAKIFGFSVLYKGKSYSFIQEKHPYRAPQAKKKRLKSPQIPHLANLRSLNKGGVYE